MEGGNLQDSYGSKVKEEYEDFNSPPVEVIVYTESPNVDDKWINSCSTEPLLADPWTTSSLCNIENEACQQGNEQRGISQKIAFPGPSALNHLPPVDADPDPEQTRRLLDNALQEIISKVTKRRRRKRRASQIPTDAVKRQGMTPPELFPSASQPMTDCVVPLPQESGGPSFSGELQTVNGSPVNVTPDPLNIKAAPVNTSTPATSLKNSEILQCELLQQLADVPSGIESSDNRDEMLLKYDENIYLPSAKKHSKKRSSKKSEQRSPPKEQIPTETLATLSTNLSLLVVPQVPDLSYNNGFETPSWRAEGGDPSPAGGTPASAGANALAEGAQEASGIPGLKIKSKKQIKELSSFSKRIQNRELEKTIASRKVKEELNLDDEKVALMPPIRPVLKQRKLTHLQKPTPICDLCGRGFCTYCELTSHMRLHTASVRRYFCSLCKSRFGHAEALSSHVRKRHDIVVPLPSSASVIAGGGHWAFAYSCNKCDKFFQRRAELNDHLLEIHGVARLHVVQGVASAMMGMSRMRGAITKQLSNPLPNSNTPRTSSFDKSTKQYKEGVELTSDSSSQPLYPSRLPVHDGQNLVSDFSASRAGTCSPPSIRCFSRSSDISSSSSISISTPSIGISTLQRALKHRLSSPSANPCPVHDFPRKNLNSLKNYKNSYSKPAQLISRTHSVTEKGFEGKLSDGSKHVHHLKKNTVLRDDHKGSVSHKAKSHLKSKANFHVPLQEGSLTYKKKARTEKIPCPVHEKYVLESVKDIAGKAGTKKIALVVKPSHGTSSSLQKPLADDSSNGSYESTSPSDSDSVISISSPNSVSVSEGEHRSFSKSHVSSQVIFKTSVKERHSFPSNSPHSHITEMKSLKTHTSAVKISPRNTNSGRKKIQRCLDVGENMLATPISHSNHTVANPLMHHTNVAHKKLPKSSCVSKKSFPNLNSSICASGANQSRSPQHTVPYVSNYPKKAEKSAKCNPFLLSLGNPVVVLERIDSLLTLK